MDGSKGLKNSKVRRSGLKLQTPQPSKKRKVVVETSVVAVKVEIGGGGEQGRQKSEGPPSDCWSWRKYGQKPIKGSPYPRGYYRCSTSKDCMAKKQVERCRTDASLLIVTYTSTHNHPPTHLTQIPDDEQQLQPNTSQITNEPPLIISGSQDMITSNNQEEENPFGETPTFYDRSPNVVFDHHQEEEEQQPLVISNYPLDHDHGHDHDLIGFSTPPKSSDHENDFYDDLEELPTSSSSFTSSTSFRRSTSFFYDIILVHPS